MNLFFEILAAIKHFLFKILAYQITGDQTAKFK